MSLSANSFRYGFGLLALAAACAVVCAQSAATAAEDDGDWEITAKKESEAAVERGPRGR